MIWFLPPRFLNPPALKSLSLSAQQMDNSTCQQLSNSTDFNGHNVGNTKKFGTMGIVKMIPTVPKMSLLTKLPQEQ